MQETKTYQCIQPVRFNGKSYPLGADIELTDEEAAGLKASGAIPADDDDAKEVLGAADSINSTLAVAASLELTLLNASLETANNKVDTLTGDLATSNSKVTQLTTDLEGASSRESQLSSDLSTANSKVSQLTTDLATANSRVGELTTNIGLADTKLAELTTELAAEKMKTERLTSDLATANANIAAAPKTGNKKTDQAK